MKGPFSGLLVPMLTPFADDLAIDTRRCIEYCEQLFQRGADGVVVFGTTGEANSMTIDERKALLTAMVDSGISPSRLMVGVGGCSVGETTQLMRRSAELGVGGVLLLPPFYYKTPVVTDEGLFGFVEQVIAETADAKSPIYLYHIPQVTQIGWHFDLIRQLINTFPDRIIGEKDSCGDWEHTKTLIDAFPELDIFPGFELTLLESLRAGGLGCITATGNINVAGIRAICKAFEQNSDDAESLQAKATAVRLAVQEFGPPITVMKSYIAHKTGIDSWANVRPPLVPLSKTQAEALDEKLTAIGYESEFE